MAFFTSKSIFCAVGVTVSEIRNSILSCVSSKYDAKASSWLAHLSTKAGKQLA